MARRVYKRDRNGRFARKAGSALAKRAGSSAVRTRPPTRTPSQGMSYKKAGILFGTVGIAAVATNRAIKRRRAKKESG